MKRFIFLSCICMAIAFFHGCRKHDKLTDVNQEPRTWEGGDLKDVEVVLPAGSAFNFSGAQLFSLGVSQPVTANGKTKAINLKDGRSIGYVFDKDGNPVLAGFISSGKKTISPESTAEVILYLKHFIPLQADTLTDVFLAHVKELPGYSKWITDFTDLWKKDPLVFSKGGYKTALEQMSAITSSTSGEKATVAPSSLKIQTMMASKPADINIESATKSGLQVYSENLSEVIMANKYRRRAHAFFYKMKYKDMNGAAHTVLNTIDNNTGADKDMAVDPTPPVNSVTGEFGKFIEGEAGKSFRKTSGPAGFMLEEAESEATYKVRIVGPGVGEPSLITSVENQKLIRLKVETFIIDVVYPVIASAYGMSDMIESVGSGKPGFEIGAKPDNLENLILKGQLFIESGPDIYEDVKQGNYKNALSKVMDKFVAGTINDLAKEFLNACLKAALDKYQAKYGLDAAEGAKLIGKSVGNVLNTLKAIDFIMQMEDVNRIFQHLNASKQLDEWDMVLKGGKVTLEFVSGYDSLLNPNEKSMIKADIKNMEETGGDQHPFFEWSTTGKYGKLADTKGHSGTSFATADHIVSYESTEYPDDLSDGNNIDYIYVKASFNNVLIGTDTIAVNVKKQEYEMKPADGVVTGKKHDKAANNVTLYLQKTNGQRDIPNHANLDFKVEWSTPGVYGNLVGAATTYNDDDIVYKATSEQVGTFTENITARVYAKAKGAADEFYSLFSVAKSKVKIDNEEKKKILHIPLKAVLTDTVYSMGGDLRIVCMGRGVAYIPIEKDAVRYYARAMGTGISWVDNGSGWNWNAGTNPGWFIGYGYPLGISGNEYTLAATVLEQADGPYAPGVSKCHTNSRPVSGMVEVTIWLK